MARINFTKAALDGLPTPPPGKRALYQDHRHPGLSIRVTSSGIKTFYVFKRPKHGAPEMIAIGRYPDITIEMARNSAMEIVSALARGASFVQSHRDRRDELTLSALFQLFLDRHAKPYKKTWKNDESNFNLYLGRTLGSRKLSEVSRRSITELMDEVTSGGRSPVTTERAVLSLGRKLFNWAKEKSLWSGENPFVGISGAKKNRRARFLLPHELPRFFKAVAQEENDTIRDFILLALLTGQRRGNVQAMKWRDVDLKSGVWHIDAADFKNGEHQAVPLTSSALELLKKRRRKLPKSEMYVLPAQIGETGHLIEPKKGWKRILRRAEAIGLAEMIAGCRGVSRSADELLEDALRERGLTDGLEQLRHEARRRRLDPSLARLDDLVMHDLRRSMGSWQAINGASLAIIGRSLGHKSPQATAIYARLHLDPVRDSMERAAESMLRAGTH